MRLIELVLTVTLVAVFWCASLTDTAIVVRPQRLSQVSGLINEEEASSSNHRILRAVETSGNNGSNKRICYNTPCGWAVYVPLTRNVDYFMRNTCECPDKTYKCVRTGDDLSASAYVYRCRQNTTADDIESPEEVL